MELQERIDRILKYFPTIEEKVTELEAAEADKTRLTELEAQQQSIASEIEALRAKVEAATPLDA